MSPAAVDRSNVQGEKPLTPYEFVSNLARELSAGRVELPGFPDVAARLQHALADADITTERIGRVVGSDAGLTGRVLALANSAMLRRGGNPITDLKFAVTRIGQENIRAAALAYAQQQLRRAVELAPVRGELEKCWMEGVRVAALAQAIARESRRLRTDEAMLAGLMHNIGKIYIVARSVRLPELFGPPEQRDTTLREWHPAIGQALTENWKLPAEISSAVGGQLDVERDHLGPPDLHDLLIVAVRLEENMAAGHGDDATLVSLPAANRLALNEAALVRIVLESQTDIETLQAALG
ncbi:MAG: HDOD domain-containing protein [Steroidobacteraceae bacterium]